MPNITHLTAAQVADRLGCDVSTVNRKVRRGQLAVAVKAPGIRGAHLFTEKEIDRYLTERRHGTSRVT